MPVGVYPRKKRPLLDRFLSHVNVHDNVCWEWNARKDRKGYGILGIDGIPRLAHRVVYELYVGSIPSGMLVCHTCDNPGCVNPSHLFIGTYLDNTRDAMQKKRLIPPPHPKGTDHSNTHLTDEQVREIRQLSLSGVSQRKIAKQYGLVQPTVGAIVRHETWRYVI